MFFGTRKYLAIVLFTLLVIVLANFAWWFYHQRTGQLLDSQLSRRLTAIAAAGAVMVDAGQLERLLGGDIDAYADIAAVLAQLQATDSLAELFILDENYRYLVTTAIEPDTAYFLAGLNSRYIDSLFFGQADCPLVTPTYETGQLYLKAAFSPLYDSAGYVAAVLGVEANVDYFDVLSELRNNLFYASGLSVLGGLVLALAFLLLQHRINRTERRLFLNETHAYLGRMVAVVAHELKNPLMIIRASAERLTKLTDAGEARYIEEEVDRLNGIVSGYLGFARSDHSLLTGDSLESFDLTQLMSGVKRHFHDKYRTLEIIWFTDDPSAPIAMRGYPRSLRQVLLNLLINGAEACQSAGRPIAVGVRAEDGDSWVLLSVLDQGLGMDPRELKKAFQPFYTTKQSGSGLGLYLSKKIVEEMGGNVEIVSVRRKQTEVKIRLPKKPRD